MTMIPATDSKTMPARMRRRTRIIGMPLLAYVRFPDGACDQFGSSLAGYWQIMARLWKDGVPTLQLMHADDYRVIYVSPREVERVRR